MKTNMIEAKPCAMVYHDYNKDTNIGFIVVPNGYDINAIRDYVEYMVSHLDLVSHKNFTISEMWYKDFEAYAKELNFGKFICPKLDDYDMKANDTVFCIENIEEKVSYQGMENILSLTFHNMLENMLHDIYDPELFDAMKSLEEKVTRKRKRVS